MDTRSKTDREWFELSQKYLKNCLNQGEYAEKAVASVRIKDVDQSLQQKLSSRLGETFSKYSCLEYQAFLAFSVNRSRQDLKARAQKVEGDSFELHEPMHLHSLCESGRRVFKAAEHFLIHFIAQNHIAKTVMSKFQHRILNDQGFESGVEVEVDGKVRTVSNEVHRVYECIREAQAGDYSHHEAWCRIVQIFILASCHKKTLRPNTHQIFYDDICSDLMDSFGLDARASIECILRYLSKKNHAFAFFGKAERGIEEIKAILGNEELDEEVRIKQVLVLADKKEKNAVPCSIDAQHFYENMPTLLQFSSKKQLTNRFSL